MVKSRRKTSCARIGFEPHAFADAGRPVFEIAAEGGDFHVTVALMHQHHAEMGAHAVGTREQPQKFVGLRGSRDVEIFGDTAKQQVAHAAADQVRGVPGGSQTLDDGPGQLFGTHAPILNAHANLVLPNFL